MDLPKRRVAGVKAARTAMRNSAQDNKLTLNYFQQLIDVETVCDNAYRALRIEVAENKDLPEIISEEEWKSQFNVPIITRY